METDNRLVLKSAIYGLTGTTALLAVYFSVVSLISGRLFALEQFSRFWYFIVSLATGFGIQIGLYVFLKNAVHQNTSKSVVAVSGTASTAAMLSCCAHYLVNILPIIGVTGIISVIGQYQIPLFWIGLLFNAAGIIYIARKVFVFRQS